MGLQTENGPGFLTLPAPHRLDFDPNLGQVHRFSPRNQDQTQELGQTKAGNGFSSLEIGGTLWTLLVGYELVWLGVSWGHLESVGSPNGNRGWYQPV